MSQVRRSIADRVQRYGLRVICARCATSQRHFPRNGRLRDARCRCGGELRTERWAADNDVRWAELVKRQRALVAPFTSR